MNTAYLDTLPEKKNKYNVDLQPEEKVIFTSKPSCFGTEKGGMLGAEPLITMTNKRLIADNGLGVWTVDIAEDIADWKRVESKYLIIFKMKYIQVNLNTEVTYGNGEKLTGYQFYFNRSDMAAFENIMKHLD